MPTSSSHTVPIGLLTNPCFPLGLLTKWPFFKGLDVTQLERKIRLLALADLGFQNIGQDLPYSRVATTLQVSPSEVERWVIDGT